MDAGSPTRDRTWLAIAAWAVISVACASAGGVGPGSGSVASGSSSSGSASTGSADGGGTSSGAAVSSSGSASGTSVCKRGLAYGHALPADQAAAVPGIGWWYNWSPSPDPAVQASYASLGLEFVPMQWGGKVDAVKLGAAIPPGARYLLGFNEPNFKQQANLTPEAAAAAWPQLEQVALAKGLKLVSPAVNFCGPASACVNGDTSPFDWLDAFFAACTGCQVDYLGVHIYLQDGAGLQSVLGQYEARYHQPIWLTEWGDLGGGVSAADELKLMQQALPILETDPRVFRYAWFTGRASDQPSLNLFGADAGLLTPLGQTYVGAPGACAP